MSNVRCSEFHGRGTSNIQHRMFNVESIARSSLPSPGAPGEGAQTTRTRPVEWFGMILAAAIFASLPLAGSVKSEGFHEAACCTRYQYARFALGEPHYLVNLWGRPFVTALSMVPAVLGRRTGVRLTSLEIAITFAAVAYRLAKFQNYHWAS